MSYVAAKLSEALDGLEDGTKFIMEKVLLVSTLDMIGAVYLKSLSLSLSN